MCFASIQIGDIKDLSQTKVTQNKVCINDLIDKLFV